MTPEQITKCIFYGIIIIACAVALIVERHTPEEKQQEDEYWRKRLCKRQDEDINLDQE